MGKTKEMTSEGPASDDLTPEARERLERIAIEIIGIASKCGRNTQQKLRQLADQISEILDP